MSSLLFEGVNMVPICGNDATSLRIQMHKTLAEHLETLLLHNIKAIRF